MEKKRKEKERLIQKRGTDKKERGKSILKNGVFYTKNSVKEWGVLGGIFERNFFLRVRFFGENFAIF